MQGTRDPPQRRDTDRLLQEGQSLIIFLETAMWQFCSRQQIAACKGHISIPEITESSTNQEEYGGLNQLTSWRAIPFMTKLCGFPAFDNAAIQAELV